MLSSHRGRRIRPLVLSVFVWVLWVSLWCVWLATYTCTYIAYICASVYVLAGNTSALLLVGPGDMERRQPCVSQHAGSGMMYFLLRVFILPIDFILLWKGLQSFPVASLDLCPSHNMGCSVPRWHTRVSSQVPVGRSGHITWRPGCFRGTQLLQRCWAHGRTFIYLRNIQDWTLTTVFALMRPQQCNCVGATTHRDQLCLNMSSFLGLLTLVKRLNRDCARRHSPQWREQHIIGTISTPSTVPNMSSLWEFCTQNFITIFQEKPQRDLYFAMGVACT